MKTPVKGTNWKMKDGGWAPGLTGLSSTRGRRALAKSLKRNSSPSRKRYTDIRIKEQV